MIADRIAHALDRLIARIWPQPAFVALPEAEYVIPVEPPAPEPTPLRRGESVACPVCAAPAGRSCCYVRTARKGQYCAPHQARLDAERPPRPRIVVRVEEPGEVA
jgi:hypothetical protein